MTDCSECWLRKLSGRHQRDADAERHDNKGRLRVVIGLSRLIPMIKHLEHRSAEAGDDDQRRGDPPNGTRHPPIVAAGDSTRSRRRLAAQTTSRKAGRLRGARSISRSDVSLMVVSVGDAYASLWYCWSWPSC